MNIKELRQRLGLTQDQLAKATGIPRGRISQWEAGNSNPKFEDQKKLREFEASKGIKQAMAAEPDLTYQLKDAPQERNKLWSIDTRLLQIQVALNASENRDSGMAELLRQMSLQLALVVDELEVIKDVLRKTIGGGGQISKKEIHT